MKATSFSGPTRKIRTRQGEYATQSHTHWETIIFLILWLNNLIREQEFAFLDLLPQHDLRSFRDRQRLFVAINYPESRRETLRLKCAA